MVSGETDYLTKLLEDSAEIRTNDELKRFVKKIDSLRIKKELNDQMLSTNQFLDTNLYERYPIYELHWLNYIVALRDIILSGEINLSRALKKVQDTLTVNHDKVFDKTVFFGKRRTIPSEIITSWRDSLALSLLTKNSDEDVECVIEIGSGPALFLFKFWLSNGPLKADYYALEITKTGRLFSNIISCLDSNISLKSSFFDYQKPDFSKLRCKYKKILIYSKGSIEQIPKLPLVFFKEILALSEQLTCVHFEPVGWQIVKPYKQNLLTRKHRKRCIKKNYNTNLWSQLKELEDSGQLTINDYAINFSGKSDHYESYISWTKRQ